MNFFDFFCYRDIDVIYISFLSNEYEPNLCKVVLSLSGTYVSIKVYLVNQLNVINKFILLRNQI